jgi:flagellar motor switch protein FliM
MTVDTQEGVIPYDLRSQDRIIRGRMPSLEIIQDRFVRMFRITLSGALRKPVNMSVRSTELIKFGKFLKTLPVPASLNLYRMNPLRGTAIMVLETRLIYNLVDIFYGGTGELEVKAEGRDYTPIEQRLVKRVVISALEDTQTAWRPVFPVQMSYQRTEINPQFVAVVPQSEVVVVTTYDVEMGGAPMVLATCVPYSMIEPIRSKLDSGFQSDQAEGDSVWGQRLTSNLKKAKVTLAARTDCQPISVREFIKLKEGDFLLSDNKPDQSIDVYINGVRKMTGMMGQDKDRQTLMVNEVFESQIPSLEFQIKSENSSPAKTSAPAVKPAPPPAPPAEIGSSPEEIPLASLKKLEPKMVARQIQKEHPQTVALILAHIGDPEQTAQILKELPENLQADVIYRMAILESIPPGVIKEIEEVLAREMKSSGAIWAAKVGGVEAAAEVLNTMDKTTESRILATIEASNAPLAEQIRELMFTFEDLVLVDPNGMQAILKEVPQNELVLSLKSASEAVKNHIFGNMSEAAADMVRNNLEAVGPVRVADVDIAQQKMVRVARKLEAEGKIIIVGPGGGDVI